MISDYMRLTLRPLPSVQEDFDHSFIRRIGGEDEDRTHDLRIANAALSQLSYPPDPKEILNRSVTDVCGECSWHQGAAAAHISRCSPALSPPSVT
jgi:hypothetical protein